MDKGGHLLLGAALGLILILATHYYLGWFDFENLNNIGLMIVIIYVYSLISDGDMKNSSIVWTFIPIGLLAAVAGYVLHNEIYLVAGLGLACVTVVMAQFFPHRGFTHSILFGVALSLPWIYLSYEYSLLAFLCFYSHNIGDGEFFKII